MHHLLLLPALIAPTLAASNRTWGPVVIAGNPFSGILSEPDDALLQQNLQHPNITRSVMFKPFDKSLATDDRDPPIRHAEWNLRVNVSSMYIPNAQASLGSGSPDGGPESHVVATSWDLWWASGGNLSSTMGMNETLCVLLPDTEDWPVGITNAYAESAANSTSCEPVFGAECVKAILATSSSNFKRCNTPTKAWHTLPECEGSWGAAYKAKGSSNSYAWGLDPDGGNSTIRSKNITIPVPMSGDAIGAQLSAPVNEDAGRTYYEAANRLQVIMLASQFPISGGYQLVSDLLCMRVNYTKLADNGTVKNSVLLPSGSARVDAGRVVSLAVGMFVAVAFLMGGL